MFGFRMNTLNAHPYLARVQLEVLKDLT